MNITKHYKEFDYMNPIITQHYGADPYAMEYNGRIYFYMTADKYEYDEAGEIKENSYSKIKSLYVVSTADMANFEDHGEVTVACDDAAKWAHNSWAPAACHKTINGKEKFFLYFADNGGGIGVLSADSPVGPFTDPIGKGLVTRETPTCAEVTWLFDPAVLVDDDGTGYLYFGGGVPMGKAACPGTARVCKLGADMVSLDGDPVAIPNVPFLFEDSGIHKFNNKYYYTYCSNFSVTEEGTKEFGFKNGEICVMVSDSPMGPFEYQERILENPGDYFRLYGNNHHCVFSFKGQWYMTYHARSLEGLMGIEHGYRVTHVDEFIMQPDGKIGTIKQGYTGRKQVKTVDPFKAYPAACVSQMAGVTPVPADEVTSRYGVGTMNIKVNSAGDFTQVKGVEFSKSATTLTLALQAPKAGQVLVYTGSPEGNLIASLKVEATDSIREFTANVTTSPKGSLDLFFVFDLAEGSVVKEWYFS